MLASLAYGSGPPVILLHGLLGSKINMAGAAKALGSKFRAIAIDLRNHGESFHHNAMNYRILAADIGGFMDDNGIETASLVGHSMGGKCAMQFALSFAERVDRLVVVDIAPRQYEDPAWTTYIEAMLSVEPEKISSRSQADAILKKEVNTRIYRQFLLSNLINDNNDGYRWRPNLTAIFNAREEISAAVTGEPSGIKSLFIRGECSPYIQDGDLEAIAKLFPESTTVSVPGCGHLVHIEARDRFNQLLIDFLLRDQVY